MCLVLMLLSLAAVFSVTEQGWACFTLWTEGLWVSGTFCTSVSVEVGLEGGVLAKQVWRLGFQLTEEAKSVLW